MSLLNKFYIKWNLDKLDEMSKSIFYSGTHNLRAERDEIKGFRLVDITLN
jgi:hypothetical protein